MARVAFPTLLERLGKRPPSAAVFLHGEEEFLREEALRSLLDLLLDPTTRDFNFDQLKGSDASAEAVGSFLATPPMMADYRVVVIRDAQGLGAKAREEIEDWLERPSPGVALILTATIPSGSKAKFYETLRKRAMSVEFATVDALDLPGWLVEYSRETHRLEMDFDAARALGAAIGAHLGVLAAEVEKLAAYVGDRSKITVADIEAVAGFIPRVDRWRWFDRIGERKFRDALEELPDLLASGESAVGLVMGIGGHLLKVGILVAGGRDALDRALRPNQRWLVNRLQPQARVWTADQVDRAMADLLRTDRLLKSASLTDRQALEELLLRLASGDDRSGVARPASLAMAVS
jgi:DNA polymerase III subunit delta